MIGTISKYPEYKGFMSEEKLRDLQKWWIISWKFYNFLMKKLSILVFKSMKNYHND